MHTGPVSRKYVAAIAVIVLATVVLAARARPARSGPQAASAEAEANATPAEHAGTSSATRLTRSPAAGETREVILATRRDRALHLFDAATLEPLGSIAVHNLAHRVSARPDGRMLFIAQAATPDGNGCCALFALDLETTETCRLIEPAMEGVVSPDGRWLFGTTQWQGASLDVVDTEEGTLLRRLPAGPAGTYLPSTGTWLGEQFYLYTHDGQQASLRAVGPDTSALDAPLPLTVALPGVPADELPRMSPLVVAGGERLLLYEPLGWWFKLDARREGGGTVHGGIFVLDPAAGSVTAHLAPSLDFAQVIAGADGHRLYALDTGRPEEGRPVRLLALDSTSGEVLAERTLADDVWFIAAAALPEALVPGGEVRPAPCPRAEPPPLPAAPPPRAAPPATQP